MALLLVGWLLAFALAYLLSDQRIAAQVGVDAQLRANRFLPAPLALAAVLAALLLPAAGSLHSALGWPLRGAMAGVLLGGLGSWVGAVHWPDAGVGVAYRGRCYELVGLYMAQTHPDPLGPRRDWQVCDGFAPPGPQECFEGWLWGIGQSQVYPGAAGWQLSELGVRGCSALPEPWQGDCWRQVSGRGTPAVVAAACDRLPPAGRWRCREGYGFYLADHYGFAPDKVAAQLQRDAPSPQDRRAYARGFGPLLRHELAELATADAWCSRLPAEDRADCREGAALAFGLEGRALPR